MISVNSTTDNSTLEFQIIGRLLTFPQEMQEALDIGLKKINFSDKDLGNLYEEMAEEDGCGGTRRPAPRIARRLRQ